MDAVNEVKRLAKLNNLKVIHKGNGHYQIIGEHLTVNYYPNSKKKTAYVNGTKRGKANATPFEAVKLALKPPPKVSGVKRKKSYKKERERLIRKASHDGGLARCHWCNTVLTLEESTLDHRIPLARGGLDNRNNYVLSCKPCNHGRGSDMPEIKVRS